VRWQSYRRRRGKKSLPVDPAGLGVAGPAKVLGERKAAAPSFSDEAAFLGGRKAEGGDGHVIPMYCRRDGVKRRTLARDRDRF
jgi:hypothetical protein